MAQYWNTTPGYMQQPQNFGNTYPPQQTNGAWGGSTQFSAPVSIVPINGGRPAAEDYPVAPGAKVILVDVSELVSYIKERDAQGRYTSFTVYDWTVREEPKPESSQTPVIDYDKIRAMISEEVSAAIGNKQKNYKKEAK